MSVLNVVKGQSVKIMGYKRKVLAVYRVKGAVWFLVNVKGETRTVFYSNSHVFA